MRGGPASRGAERAAGGTPAPGARAAPDLDLYRVLDGEGGARPVTDPVIAPTVAARAYREMKRLRMLDARMVLLQRQGRIGFYGACTGQEATPIGTALALEPDDWVFPALRESAVMLARGLPLSTYLHQVFGNGADLLKGRQQPMHMAARQVHQVSWSSCIGTQLPHAVGAAWAAKLRKERTAVVGFVGDGGSSEPDFHHALNFAGVFQVPCVIICQNNHFAISIRSEAQTAARTFAIKGRGYGVRSLRVDGNDVLAVYHAVAQALARARRGQGPTFIEAVTFRVGAHSTSDDPSRYRSQEEVDAWLARDPVQAIARHLERLGALDPHTEQQIEAEINAEISKAIRIAEEQAPPARDTLFDDIYAELPWHLVEQRDELRTHPHRPDGGGGA